MKKAICFFAVILFVTQGSAQMFSEGKFPLFPYNRSIFAESTHHFDVRHYRIDLDLPMNSGAMTAHARVELIARRNNFDTFSLHFVDLVCDSVRRAGNVCSFTTGSGRLLITLDRVFSEGESLAVDIYYRRNAGTRNRGFFFYNRGTQGIPYAICYSTTQPSDSRYWFPCFDEPWDKAERGCQVNITTPDSMSGCANGLLDSVTVSAGKKTCWWTHRYPISTYLITFAASKWATFQQWFPISPTESLPIQNFMWPQDSSRAVSAFANIVDMLSFFSDTSIYGPYPFEKYGHVVAYPFQWGGMENQTMTMVHRYWIQNGNDNGIAHELAHHWWGDMVTCLDWANIWLNEGFATYSDALYNWHQHGINNFLNLIRSRAQDYFEEEAEDPHPIYNPPPGHEFDWGHSYCKASWVQHMLRYVVGDTIWSSPGIFFRVLRAYGDSFRYRNASTEDYQRITERITGLDLNWFFNEWVYSLGYPNYHIGWSHRQPHYGWELIVDLAQDNMNGAPETFHMPVEIKVLFASGDTIIRYPVTENPQRNIFPLSQQPVGLQFDPNEWILEQHSITVGLQTPPETKPAVNRLELSTRTTTTRTVLINYALPRAERIGLEIFDPSGRKIKTVFDGQQTAGRFSARWSGDNESNQQVSSGVYLVRLSAGNKSLTGKVVLLN